MKQENKTIKDLLLIPNLLTISRMILIFPALYFFHREFYPLAILLIVLLFLTDFLDGMLARKLNMESFIGAILDPVADKIVVLSFFSYLAYFNKVFFIYFLLILIRDISQLLSIPVLLMWKKIPFKVKPKMIPKWGTALNFILLGILFFDIVLPILNFEIMHYLLISIYFISGCIEVYILVTYIPRFVQIYKGEHDTFE
ncbi:MAG: CDP-alcohol phosphatidyltransferase family protein [Leptospiraceae bacterium]|nr:CDP-alcohol phosphatidyltransferase family protein [Leptospiraceae bacterium]